MINISEMKYLCTTDVVTDIELDKGTIIIKSCDKYKYFLSAEAAKRGTYSSD